MLDRAVLARGVYRLEDQQHRPVVLGIEHVLKLGERIDAHRQRFLGARLVLRRQVEAVPRIDVLQAETVIGHAERLGKFARLLDYSFHIFVVHGFTSFFVAPLSSLFSLTFYVRGEGVRASGRCPGRSLAKRNIFSTSTASCLRSLSTLARRMRDKALSFLRLRMNARRSPAAVNH